jgi:succinate dehydrogenase / fumarate reductase, flavoprotein subunit
MKLESNIPAGPLESKWSRYKFDLKLVNPANRKKFTVIVVGTGLAGASAAATLAEQGYNVLAFTIQDSPRRAHSIAAQGGINAAKNYANDGDSVYRLFYDTIKGGDYPRPRGQRAPPRRSQRQHHRSGRGPGRPLCPRIRRLPRHPLLRRRAGRPHLLCSRPDRPATLLGAYSALMRQVGAGRVAMFPRREMLDLVIAGGKARGIVVRNLITGELERHAGDAVLLCTGGYGNAYYLSTNAMNSNVSAAWRCHRRGALFANPCFTQIHPTCIPVSGDYQSKLTLMSESLRNDGRVWVPKQKGDKRPPSDIPEEDRDYYLERRYPSFGNLVPRDVASRRQKVLRRRPRRRRFRPCRLPRFPRRHPARRRKRHPRNATATSSTCTSASWAKTPTRSP